jgi:chemotaxis protein MotB
MFKKRKIDEEHGSLERWLLTYADLITLLLGLFVILYAASKVDKEKFNAMSEALNKQWGGGTGILPGNMAPVLQSPVTGNEKTKLDTLQDKISIALKDIPESEGVTFEKSQFGLVMHFKDRLLFELGKADLRGNSFVVLNAVGEELRKIPNDLLIEGHTDTIPINTKQFPSNMHLSSMRALNTLLFLTEVVGVPRDRISVRGFGEFKPRVQNNSDSNRAKNRRVDIVIVNEKQ